jgi:hypothetical protein
MSVAIFVLLTLLLIECMSGEKCYSGECGDHHPYLHFEQKQEYITVYLSTPSFSFKTITIEGPELYPDHTSKRYERMESDGVFWVAIRYMGLPDNVTLKVTATDNMDCTVSGSYFLKK